jgi:hypothetical protein
MNRTSKSLRLTERDIEYITWIAEQQAVRLDTLQLLFEIRGKKIDPRALRRLVERWQSEPERMVRVSGRKPPSDQFLAWLGCLLLSATRSLLGIV